MITAAGGTVLGTMDVVAFKPAPFTILGWLVDDIASAVGALNKKGVQFERFAWMEQDRLGVWNSPGGAKVAWFEHPQGNVLSVTQG